MSPALRWLLLVPAAVAAWLLAVLLATVLLGGLRRLCPDRQVVSGMCVAPWFGPASDAVVALGAALAAIFVLRAVTVTAPSHKKFVAVVAYLAGALIAAWLGIESGQYLALFATLLAGALTLVFLLRRRGDPALG